MPRAPPSKLSADSKRTPSQMSSKRMFFVISDKNVDLEVMRRKNNKTSSFNVLYSDKTWVFDQSGRAQGPIYIRIFLQRIEPFMRDLARAAT